MRLAIYPLTVDISFSYFKPGMLLHPASHSFSQLLHLVWLRENEAYAFLSLLIFTILRMQMYFIIRGCLHVLLNSSSWYKTVTAQVYYFLGNLLSNPRFCLLHMMLVRPQDRILDIVKKCLPTPQSKSQMRSFLKRVLPYRNHVMYFSFFHLEMKSMFHIP